MNNEGLIELVKWHPIYRENQCPEFDRVLEVMLQIDRKKFLDEEPVGLYHVNFSRHKELDIAEQSLNIPPRGRTSERTYRRKLRRLHRAVTRVTESGRPYFLSARDLAYSDYPLPIGHGQTCSQPSVVAFMAYLLELEEGMKVFEIGLGCGYSAAVTLRLIGNGRLVTAEFVPELVEKGTRNLETHFGKTNLEGRLKVIRGDGSIGLEEEAPFDRIYLTAGVKLNSFDPFQLAKHLNPIGGILLFPEENGDLIKQRYADSVKIYEKKYSGFSFVPLKGKNS